MLLHTPVAVAVAATTAALVLQTTRFGRMACCRSGDRSAVSAGCKEISYLLLLLPFAAAVHLKLLLRTAIGCCVAVAAVAAAAVVGGLAVGLLLNTCAAASIHPVFVRHPTLYPY